MLHLSALVGALPDTTNSERPDRLSVGVGGPVRVLDGRSVVARAGAGMKRGQDHHLWRDNASPRRIHAWLREHYPKTGRCEECGRECRTDFAFKRHPEPHTRDRSDYRELCQKCHRSMDAKPQSHCRRGHALTPENVLVCHGRRWCKTCRNTRRREWRAARAAT